MGKDGLRTGAATHSLVASGELPSHPGPASCKAGSVITVCSDGCGVCYSAHRTACDAGVMSPRRPGNVAQQAEGRPSMHRAPGSVAGTAYARRGGDACGPSPWEAGTSFLRPPIHPLLAPHI